MNTDAVQTPTDSSAILDLAGFDAAELHKTPFEYLVMSNFIQADALAGIVHDFPSIKQAGSFPPDTLQFGPAFNAMLQALEGAAFRHAVERKFGLDLTGRPVMMTVRGHTDETDGRIHTDSQTKIITVLIYFNESWQNAGGRLRLLRSATDMDDYVAEVEPSIGTLLIFRRSENSWHGHQPFVGVRRALQLNWVVDEQVKRREQQRHGVSAFFKRLFGHKEYAA